MQGRQNVFESGGAKVVTIVLPLKGLAAWHRHECNDGIIAYNSWGTGGAVSPPPPPGPGQSNGRGPGGGASGSS